MTNSRLQPATVDAFYFLAKYIVILLNRIKYFIDVAAFLCNTRHTQSGISIMREFEG